MAELKATVREKTVQILMRLTEEERRVFSAVLRIEREKMHQRNPYKINDDLLKIVRDIVKELSV